MNRQKPEAASHGTAFSLGLYVLLSTAAFFSCLFLGRAYFDNDLLAQFGPWRAFLRGQMSQGRFPLWDPYLLGGQPFFADLQNMMLYPFNYLTLPFSVPYGLGVFFFIHMAWAALGMHLWLRSLRLSEAACRVGALLFASSNFFWLELVHPPVLAAFAWVPWLFLCLESLAESPKPRAAFLCGLSFALLFLCGSFQVTLGSLYGGLAYLLYRLRPRLSGARNKSPGPFASGKIREALFLGFFFLWGALPLLGQFIPTLEFTRLSDRGVPDAQTEKFDSRLSLNPATLGQFLFPRITLPPGRDMAVALQSGKDDPEFPMAADWGYLGVWLPFLAAAAWGAKDRSLPFFLSFFAAFSLVFCFGRYTPLHSLLSGLLPGLSLVRVPYRFLFLYVLGAAALAALGWERLFQQDSGAPPAAFTWKSPLVYAFGLYLAALVKPSRNWREILGLGLGWLGFELFALSRFKQTGRLTVAAALALPLLLNGWADFETGPSSNFDFEKKSKAILTAAGSLGPSRLIFMNGEMLYPIQVGGRKYFLNYPQDAACALKIRNFGGYNPLVLGAKRDIGGLPLPAVTQLGAVGGILTQVNHGKIPGFQLESFPPYLLYRRQKPPPTAYAPTRVLSAPDPAKGLALLQKPDFDAARVAVVSGPIPQGEPAPVKGIRLSPVECRLTSEEPDREVYSVGLSRSGLVVFCEVMYPGWKAWVDGKPASILTADHLLRSLYMAAGTHEVEFRFEPPWWGPLRIGLGLWLILTLLAALGALPLPQGGFRA